MEGRTSAILAFTFGVLFVTALLVFALFVPNPTIQQFEIVRIILALAAGGVAAMIPGLLSLKLGATANVALRAGGALAVFVIVYFYSPARWAPPSDSAITQKTIGPNSPAIIGNDNVVGAPNSPAEKR
jgi:hypothetical protein